MTHNEFQELKRLLGHNREAIEGNRKAIEGNREAIEATDGRLDRHISAVDGRFERFEAKLAEESCRTREELTEQMNAMESRLGARIDETVESASERLMRLTASMFEHQTGEFQKLNSRLDAVLGEGETS